MIIEGKNRNVKSIEISEEKKEGEKDNKIISMRIGTINPKNGRKEIEYCYSLLFVHKDLKKNRNMCKGKKSEIKYNSREQF